MLDRTSKVILAAIALGLWLNVVGPFLRPAPAKAEELFDVVSALNRVDADFNKIGRGIASDLGSIEDGTCTNKKICH